MGWDKGRYYTRSRKVNGRVVREYIGKGRMGELAAELDAIGRERRLFEQQERQEEKAELLALDAEIVSLIEMTDLLARAALIVAGFHQHKRGEWRKKRDKRECAKQERADRPEGTNQGSGTRSKR